LLIVAVNRWATRSRIRSIMHTLLWNFCPKSMELTYH